MFDQPVLLLVLLAALLIATVRDLQIREVPDMVSYGLIAVAILGGLLVAILTSDLAYFLERLLGLGVGALVGVFMYFTRQWGGGDAKLMMGVGAILGFSRENLIIAEFLVLLILLGAAYGLAWTVALAVRQRRAFLPAFRRRIRTPRVHRMRIALVATGVLVIIAILFVPFELKLLLGFMMVFLYLLVYSWVFIRTVEEAILLKEYPIGRLTEGDWIARDVKVGQRVLLPAGGTGITKEQIALLKRSKVKNVLVKEGIPFVPGFLLAFLALAWLQWQGIRLLGYL